MIAAVAWSLAGLAALIFGAEIVVRAATRFAALVGMPPILIGLTVVAVGTSLPELAVGINAALIGSGPLVVGNIAGTNTFNLLFILGLSALLAPVRIDLRTLRVDVPIMVAAAFLLLAVAWDLTVTRMEGVVLLAGAVVYTFMLIRSTKREAPAATSEFDAAFADGSRARRPGVLAWNGLLLAAGLVVIVIGSEWLVDGATSLARDLGVSDAVIGLTVVAIGTSSPELATTIVSTLRRQRDVAIGNLLGSSIYNVLVILGGALLAAPPGGLAIGENLLRIDIPVMVAATIACMPVFLNRTMSRLEGALFVAAYCLYLGYLILART